MASNILSPMQLLQGVLRENGYSIQRPAKVYAKPIMKIEEPKPKKAKKNLEDKPEEWQPIPGKRPMQRLILKVINDEVEKVDLWCSDCDFLAQNRQKLTDHHTEMHNQSLYNLKECCGLVFRTRHEFRQHYLDRHSGAKMICEKCGAKFHIKRHLVRHQEIAHVTKKRESKKVTSNEVILEAAKDNVVVEPDLLLLGEEEEEEEEDEEDGEEEEEEEDEDEDYEPKEDEVMLVDSDDDDKELKSDEGPRFMCELCPYESTTVETLDMHVERVHGEKKEGKGKRTETVVVSVGEEVKEEENEFEVDIREDPLA